MEFLGEFRPLTDAALGDPAEREDIVAITRRNIFYRWMGKKQ